jgi:fibronectin type 3 domain-containing protein
LDKNTYEIRFCELISASLEGAELYRYVIIRNDFMRNFRFSYTDFCSGRRRNYEEETGYY